MGVRNRFGARLAGRVLLIVAVGAPVLAGAGRAMADDSDLCLDEIAKQEARYGMPAGILKA
ncbi:MAG TPA: hypothetical protein VG742_11670, partial [Dongiaceae bacterium]|nr:hypothetical protein [Dongiaceae bacterium]